MGVEATIALFTLGSAAVAWVYNSITGVNLTHAEVEAMREELEQVKTDLQLKDSDIHSLSLQLDEKSAKADKMESEYDSVKGQNELLESIVSVSVSKLDFKDDHVQSILELYKGTEHMSKLRIWTHKDYFNGYALKEFLRSQEPSLVKRLMDDSSMQDIAKESIVLAFDLSGAGSVVKIIQLAYKAGKLIYSKTPKLKTRYQ